MLGAPHLARFSRDVGYHEALTRLFRSTKNPRFSAVVSHISRKTSEIWGTQHLLNFELPQPRYFIAVGYRSGRLFSCCSSRSGWGNGLRGIICSRIAAL